ncbi:DUF6770 family protein [Sporocytophaga myxococcoides]|uniref:DUF6770 family protein n=1 Tax=Sporocytophaga myxococcoides TaxID=153721 RepID=UPI000490078D|nr:DUF6770 family protein [Sporocytophaga myxococcoides]
MKRMFLKSMQLACCAVLLFFSSLSLNAQSIELDKVGRAGFKGVQKLDDKGYYVQYEETNAKPRVVKLIILDNNLVATNEIKLELKPEDKLEDLAYNGGNFMFVKSNSKEKSRTFKILDRQGKELASKEQKDVPARLLYKPAMITPVEQTDFLVINYTKDKKVGYSIERFNEKLESKYLETYEPEKKKLYPVDYLVADDVLYVLEFLSADYSDYFEYHIAGFSMTNGKQLFNNHLKSADDKAYGYATFLRLGAEGKVVTGGMYFNGPREDNATSDGLFTAVVDKAGKLNYQYKTWKDVEAKVKAGNSTNGIWGGKTKTFVQDLAVNADGSFSLIAENFRRGDEALAGGKNKTLGTLTKVSNMSNGESSDEAVTVSEFVLFDFTKDNVLSDVRKLNKPESVTVIRSAADPNDQPYVGQAKGLNLANILNNRGYFPYRFTAQKNGEKVLVYQFTYEKLFKEKLFFTKLNAATVDTNAIEITNSVMKVEQELDAASSQKMGKLGALSKKLDKASGSDIQNTYYMKGSHSPHDFRSRSLNTRVSSSNLDGKILIYDFVPELTGDANQKKSMLAKYNNGMNNAINAKLKIWYIDIR